MFLVAISKDGIADNFTSGKVEEFSVGLLKVTTVTDSVLSDIISEEHGFSVLESPLLTTSHYRDIIFSQVAFDTTRNMIFVLKSTISGRPIYYHKNQKGEFFCSTHISLLRAAGVPIEENRDVLPEFFVFRFVIPPNTLYKNIHQLLSGDQLHIRLDHDQCEIIRIVHYIPQKQNHIRDVDSIAKTTLSYLTKIIQVLDPCHGRISTYLSGGLDSSILFRICQKFFNVETTFSTSFPFEDPNNDTEKQYSLSAANAFNTKHTFYELTSGEYLTGFLEAIEKAEVPVHHLQTVPIYLLTKKIPQQNNIVISGLGADDIFGTITQYDLLQIEKNFFQRMLAKYQNHRVVHFIIQHNARLRGHSLNLQNYARSKLPLSDEHNMLWSLGAYGSEDWALEFFNTSRQEIIKNRFTVVERFSDRSIYDMISMLLFFGSASSTQAIWGKLAESERKILYYPFSHIDLIDFAFSLPWDIKLYQPKNILRFVARNLEIPDQIIERPKSGFGVDPKLWAEPNSVFESLVPLVTKIINKQELRAMQSSDSKKAMTYWNMLNYAIWKRLCIHNEPLNVLLEEIK